MSNEPNIGVLAGLLAAVAAGDAVRWEGCFDFGAAGSITMTVNMDSDRMPDRVREGALSFAARLTNLGDQSARTAGHRGVTASYTNADEHEQPYRVLR